MRRVSLALALMGAVTAACSGGANSSGTGSDPGVTDGTFTVVIQNGQAINGAPANPGLAIAGGYVTSVPAGIDCGAGAHTKCSAAFASNATVVLTATAVGTDPAFNLAYQFLGWAGDCQGEGTCSLTGTSDKYIVVMFAGERTGHPTWSDPAIHAQEYLNYVSVPQPPGTLDCKSCHGDTLQGQGLAPSCALCHSWPIGKHFEASGHNSGACARCHATAGFRDFIGADGTASNIDNIAYAGGDYTSASGPLCNKNATPPVTQSCWNDPAAPGNLGTTAQWYYAPGFTCDGCHNAATVLGGGTTYLNTHKFPSGKTVTMDGNTAICAQCHDGGRPTYEVAKLNSQLAGVTDLDAQLSGSNNKTVRAHYLPAASTLYGEEAGNWFEYSVACSIPGNYTQAACVAANDGKSPPTYGVWKGAQTSSVAADRNNYTGRNEHGGINSCTSCHNAHTGQLPKDPEILTKCGGCHDDELTGLPVQTFAQLEESRQFGFEGDIDGNGVSEPLNVELDGLRAKLLAAIQNYATNVAGTDICFDGSNRFYILMDKTVACATTPNNVEYNKYTARLLRAAYNYMIATNDAGAWAHNPRYAIEVTYDAIADLNAGLVAKGKAASPNGNRAFNGHFGGAEDASKYAALIYHGASNATTGESLPPMGFTSGACYQCHGGAGGFAAYVAAMPAALTSAVITDANKITAFQCSVCHTYNRTDMKGLVSVTKVYFPPQKNGAGGEVSFVATDLPTTFAVCGTCHSARENKASIDAKVLSIGTFNTGLVNMHYLGAAATVMGTRTKSWYEYDGKGYTAYPAFWKAGTNGNAPGPHGSPHGADCTGCHQAKASKHEFGVDYAYCGTCHAGNYALAPKEEEYASMKAELLAALDTYAQANLAAFQTGNGADATGICYDGSVYGYVLVKKATGCSTTAAKLDLKSMHGAYNLHWMNKDPGGWAHNEYYVMQLVYDSIVELGGTPSFKVCAVTDSKRVCVAGDPLNRGY